nr:tryptophan synthase subunit alpha [uncultured Niameybacter sp.]
MNRIDKQFIQLKEEGKKAFIPFITAGDPHLEATKKFIQVLDECGSHIIELGIPFSDPIADGETIQNANVRALKNPIDLDRIFNLVEEVRPTTKAALVFLIYSNMIFHYKPANFFRRCEEVGIDGVIVPDMPIEEIEEFESVAKEYNIHMIRLIAPTSTDRVASIANGAKGFLYCVSSLGVTGTRRELTTDFDEMFSEIQEVATIPTAIGFGITTPKQVRQIKNYTDGVIVGSALVKLIEEKGEAATKDIKGFVEQMIAELEAI